MDRDSARGAIQPGLKILARYAQTGLGFSARPNGPENLKKSHVIETEFEFVITYSVSARAQNANFREKVY